VDFIAIYTFGFFIWWGLFSHLFLTDPKREGSIGLILWALLMAINWPFTMFAYFLIKKS
jgi:hypothetical protein